MEKVVKGATKIKLAAPKSKYVEPILSATNGGETGVADVFHTLQLRLRDSTWTIVFKSLIIVHLMVREGAPEVTLRFLADSPRRLAISSFTEVQTQGVNIRRYYEYQMERVRAYRDTKTDFVRSGAGKIRNLTVDKGLLRQTELVQSQIRALLRCDLLGSHDPENEISLTAFRLLIMDLLELFKVMNEGTINVLEHYFEMSKVDAERALEIYKTFGKQTDQVVQYLSQARQYQSLTKLEVPRLKHAPTTLTSSLEEYLNDPDFDINRRQYLAQQEAKRTGKPIPKPTTAPTSSGPSSTGRTPFDPPAATKSTVTSRRPAASTQPKGPAPDLIDFFESIEQNQQPMAQQGYVAQGQYDPLMSQGQQFQQVPSQQMPPQQTGFNPFTQSTNYQQQQQQQQQQQPPPSQQQSFQPQAAQPLQPDFTGAGFGGYGPQAHNTQPPSASAFAFPPQLSAVPEFSHQAQSPVQPPQALQSQPTSTNPFRQSSMPTGAAQVANATTLTRQSTNPFAKHNNTGQSQQPPLQSQQDQQQQQQNGLMADQTGFYQPPSSQFDHHHHQQQQQQFPQQPTSPQAQSLQPQRTGTNPFAKNRPLASSLSPSGTATTPSPLPVNVTGSTNPFRQSQFVNQQTGQGWQRSTQQGTFGGFDVNNVDTVPVFPRPGQQ